MENINEKELLEVLGTIVKSVHKGGEVSKEIVQVFGEYDCTLEEAFVYSKAIHESLGELIQENPENKDELISEVLSED